MYCQYIYYATFYGIIFGHILKLDFSLCLSATYIVYEIIHLWNTYKVTKEPTAFSFGYLRKIQREKKRGNDRNLFCFKIYLPMLLHIFLKQSKHKYHNRHLTVNYNGGQCWRLILSIILSHVLRGLFMLFHFMLFNLRFWNSKEIMIILIKRFKNLCSFCNVILIYILCICVDSFDVSCRLMSALPTCSNNIWM